MDATQFDALVGRLENLAAARPKSYAARVIGVALLGFGILGGALGLAALSLAEFPTRSWPWFKKAAKFMPSRYMD